MDEEGGLTGYPCVRSRRISHFVDNVFQNPRLRINVSGISMMAVVVSMQLLLVCVAGFQRPTCHLVPRQLDSQLKF